MNMKTIIRLLFCFSFLQSNLLMAGVQDFQVGNVSPSGFYLFWQMEEGDDLINEVEIYLDELGSQLAEGLEIEWYPVSGIEDKLSPGVADRLHKTACVEAMQASGTQFIRVSAAKSNTSYFVRPSGSSVDLLEVKCSEYTSFVKESQQLYIDLTNVSEDLDGVIVKLTSPNSAYPLFAVCGALTENKAYFNISDFLEENGVTQSSFSNNVSFDVSIYENLNYSLEENSIDFDDDLKIASLSSFIIDVEVSPELHHFSFEVIASQGALKPFSINVYALDENDNFVTDFQETAVLSANKDFALGEGETPVFIDGKLEDYSVSLAGVGLAQLVMTKDTITNSSNSFELLNTYEYWANVSFSGATEGSSAHEDYGNRGVYNVIRYAFGLDPIDPILSLQTLEVSGIVNESGKNYTKLSLVTPESASAYLEYTIMKSKTLLPSSWESIYSFDSSEIDASEDIMEIIDPEIIEGDSSPSYFKLQISLK